MLGFKISKAFTFTEKPVRMRRKRGWLAAVSFILGSILDWLEVAKELFTGRDQLNSIFRVGGRTEVGDVHDVVLAHAQHHQVSPNWLLRTKRLIFGGRYL